MRSRLSQAARAGRTTDSDLASVAADLDVQGVPMAGVIVWDVPNRDADWANRPWLGARTPSAV